MSFREYLQPFTCLYICLHHFTLSKHLNIQSMCQTFYSLFAPFYTILHHVWRTTGCPCLIFFPWSSLQSRSWLRPRSQDMSDTFLVRTAEPGDESETFGQEDDGGWMNTMNLPWSVGVGHDFTKQKYIKIWDFPGSSMEHGEILAKIKLVELDKPIDRR